MAVDVVMPQMGESIFEGTITRWLKKPGDRVERDEPLFEISTDKVDAEIPAPAAGVLKEIKIGEGQTVPIQTVVAVIDAAGAAAAAPAPAAPAKAAAPAAKAAAPVAAAPKAAAPAPAAAAEEEEGEHIHSSPLVRRLAKEHGINLAAITGTGAGGRITKEDIMAVIEGGAQPAAAAVPARPAAPAAALPAAAPARPAPTPSSAIPAAHGAQFHAVLETGVPHERIYFGSYEVQPMSVMRQRIAEHMVTSKHVSPHVYSVDEIDMTRVAALRAKHKSEFEKRYDTKLTFMPFFVKAAVAGLRAFPTVNAS
ncbi:MAG: 2-oxo acid dehydrogenase subunit E2, partial [Acidobacteriia bacterium]|nr:2-oxo acid dehydrogenase subunit E2 [Terriglobia bacterium]